MGIVIGSARIDENGNISGGVAGDQTGKEVSTQAFYMHSRGWYVLRFKSAEHAIKMATAMFNACNNDNIGYDQTNRQAVIMVKKYGSTKAISDKTETDCGNLIRACILEATGIDVGEFYTGNEANVLEKSGLFDKRKKVTSSADVYDGDVLVTMTKAHTVAVVSGNPRGTTVSAPTESTTKVKSAAKKDSSLAGIYETTANLYLRAGAGTSKKILVTIPQGTKVSNYGYYTEASGTKWLYVAVAVNGKQYTGFCSKKYLSK